MHTTEFARSLLHGIKSFLSWMGIPRHLLDRLDEMLFLVCIVVIAFVVAAGIHFLLVRAAKRILRRKHLDFFDSLFRYSVFRKSTALIPPLIVSALLPFAFDRKTAWFTVSERITWIYFFVALIVSVNAILNTVGDTLRNNDQLKNRPMKGFIQIFQVIFTCLAVIVIVSITIGKSPVNLITGLGAFTAVLMLIFRDTILGLVAGVMISENDMVRIGDWIEMPRNGIDGIVLDISLTVIKVQNFDNTIVTVPPYSLVSESFVNWRGMTESGGRRIMRQYAVRLDCIRPCTPEFLERMKTFDAELAQFIDRKQRQAAAGQGRQHGESRRAGQRHHRHQPRSAARLHGTLPAPPPLRQPRSDADGAIAGPHRERPARSDLLLLHRQELAELRIHPGRDHGALRRRAAGLRSLCLPACRHARRRTSQNVTT